VPLITRAYITSRLESVALVLQNPLLEDILDNEEQLSEQMDALPYLVGGERGRGIMGCQEVPGSVCTRALLILLRRGCPVLMV
jgi:hypothetical protein